MMLQTRNSKLVPSLYRLWEERVCLDGMFVCRDGSVPFSRLVLASHSPVLARVLSESPSSEEEVQKIVLDSVSLMTVRSLVQLLHGGQLQLFPSSQLQELKLLLDLLQISLNSDKLLSLVGLLDRQKNSDVIITKFVPSLKRRRNYDQTKHYRDWSKVGPDQITVKEEPMDIERSPHVFTKVTYRKESRESIGQSHDMDHSYKRQKLETPDSACKTVSVLTPQKTDIQPCKSIVVTPVAVPREVEEQEQEETAVLEQETVTTLIINNDQPSLEQGSFIIQTVPHKPFTKKLRTGHNPPGEVKTEEEAKAMAAPFIGKLDTKPPKYKCMFDDCSYVNARLLMTQTHVYKHLQIFTFQCSYCDLKCRLETNFEKHLNTHGMTRRKDKVGQFIFIDEKAQQQLPSALPETGADIIDDLKQHDLYDPPPDTLKGEAEKTQAYVVLDQGQSEEDKHQTRNYHLSKKAVLLGEEKARSIISSYIKYELGKEENKTDLKLLCSICSFESEAEVEVYEHIALQHLNIYQYTCDLCSKKMKIKRQLVEHMITEHGGEMGSSTLQSTPSERIQEGGAVLDEDQFPYTEHNMSVRVGPNGAKKVYVGDAKYPLLRLNKSVLNKLVKGKMMNKKSADEIVSVYAIHNTGSRWYECALCDGQVRKEKLYLIQRHLYEHFNFYFMKCPLCNDIFRFTSQFKEHQEAHQKMMRRSREEGSKGDKIGNYHEVTDYHYIPEDEAKPVVESYYFHDESESVYICKICSEVHTSQFKIFSHCLKQHLKIFQFKCDLCPEYFQLHIEMKKHYKKAHGKTFEKSSKLDKLLYESSETDLPDVLDLSSVPMEQLKGKKISTQQAKSIKGLHMLYNEESKMHECELCDFKREWRGNLQNHVLAHHYDVFLYRCPAQGCGLLLRNWSAFQAHHKSHKTEGEKGEEEKGADGETEVDNVKYHLLESPLFVGEQKGLKIARSYHSLDKTSLLHKCSFCDFSAKSQTTSIHVLAKHLPMVHLYRCEQCDKMFRYSRVRWREHLTLHTQGRLGCPDCPDGEKLYTKESLKAHRRRNHSQGRFSCSLAECGLIFSTKAEARQHEREAHLLGLPARCVSHVCEWCDYSFPTRSRWKKHVVLCQRGTSRTGFRKQISDVLEWLGKGGYRCTFCNVEFHPDADNVTGTALPEARNHVASLHGMKHMRKAKMQWHGDPKNINKEELYKDKTNFWSAKAKDIDRMRTGDKSYEEIIETDKKSQGTVIMKIVPAQELESETIVEDGLVDHQEVVVNIVNEDGVVEQRQVVLGQSELYLGNETGQVSSDIFTNLGLEQETVIVKDMKAENVEFGEVNNLPQQEIMSESETKSKLLEAEARAMEAEEKMRQAAEFGKDLLEKNIEMGSEVEIIKQEKHELSLKLQTKLNVEKTLLGEVENLRDAIRQLEAKKNERDQDEEERWSKREMVWKAKLAEADIALQTVESREKILKERLEVSEKQLSEASEAMNQSVGGQTMSLELAELQSNNMELVQEKQRLESEVLMAKSETNESVTRGQAAVARAELLQRELEEAQCSITSYCRTVEDLKTEVMELQAQLDAKEIDNLNQDGKGNSLFSEVNDRREKVETQLKIYEEKFEVLKKNYDVKMAELQKTKMHNVKLLSIAGSGRNDSGQVSRLEELLGAERNRNKILRERLDTLDKLSVREDPIPGVSGQTEEDSEDLTFVPHTQSDEYSYLSTLLKQTKEANTDLKKQLQLQMRQSLEDGDMVRELTRRVNMLDSSSQKLRAENYSLKIQIDELKCKKGDQKVTKTEPVKIFEKLHFEKKPEEDVNPKEAFVLKEKTINKPKSVKSNSPDKKDDLSNQVKENLPVEKPKKKAACFSDCVEKISVEGNKETSELSKSSPKEKVKSKPQGKKKFGAANTIYVDTDNQAEQCKQQ